jgi:uncharacterized protein
MKEGCGSMQYRRFGSTDIEVSALGFGAMRFQAPRKTEEMAAVVYRAFQKGITYFDTAPYYCEDRSENIVGVAVKEMKKAGKPFYLSTKSGAENPATVRQQCERSLQRLQVDSIDFYHVWCLIQPDEFSRRKARGAIEEFRKLKEEGLIKHICFSTHLEYDQTFQVLEESEGLWEGMLIGVSLLNYDLRAAGIREAARRGLGVVTMNTLGGGLLTAHPDRFAFLLNDQTPTLLDAALQFNLSLPEVNVALVGFRNGQDVDTAMEAMDRIRMLSAEEIREIQQKVAGGSTDFCTRCGYCRDCPEGIPVVRLMDTYNVRMLSNVASSQEHLRYHWGISDLPALIGSCSQCRQCERTCTQRLPILERFEALLRDQRKPKR